MANTQPFVMGGQISPQLVESLKQGAAYSNQRYLQAMQAGSQERIAGTQARAQVESATIGARSRERTAAIQAGTTRDIAAMESAARDERAAEAIRDKAAGRQLQLDIFKQTQDLIDQRDEKKEARRQAIELEDRKRIEQSDKEADQIRMNRKLLERAKNQFMAKVGLEAAAAGRRSAQDNANLEVKLHDQIREWDRKQGTMDSVKEQISRYFDSSEAFTHIGTDTTEAPSVQTGAKIKETMNALTGLGVVNTLEKRYKEVQGYGRITEAAQNMEKDMINAVSTEIMKQTENAVSFNAPAGSLASGLKSGKIRVGHLQAAIVGLEAFRDKMVKERDSVSGSDRGVDKASYKAYGKAILKIDDKLDEIQDLPTVFLKENEPFSQGLAKAATNAWNTAHNEGLYALLSALVRNAPGPVGPDQMLESVREISKSLAEPVFSGKTSEEYKDNFYYMQNNYDDMIQYWLSLSSARNQEDPRQLLDRITREKGLVPGGGRPMGVERGIR
jgi:hypothetical protein